MKRQNLDTLNRRLAPTKKEKPVILLRQPEDISLDGILGVYQPYTVRRRRNSLSLVINKPVRVSERNACEITTPHIRDASTKCSVDLDITIHPEDYFAIGEQEIIAAIKRYAEPEVQNGLCRYVREYCKYHVPQN